MWPTLIAVGPIAVHTFGVFLFLGIFFGGFRLWKNAKEEGWDETSVMDTWLVSGLGAIAGARLVFVLTHWPEFSNNWYKMLFLTKFPGLTYEGAWLFGLIVLLLVALRKKLPFWHFFDMAVMAILAVEIFGHVGSFFAGSNLGQTINAWWGIAFPGVEQKRWPVQIFWAVGLWLIFTLLSHWEKHYRSFSWYQNDKGEAKDGFIAGCYLVFVGLLKLLLAFISSFRPFIWAMAMIVAGGLILLIRSGITIKAKLPAPKRVKVELKRKKRGFDYV
jgi:phosphatidylglycerol:prolipoprotein diacylglycerol transferase